MLETKIKKYAKCKRCHKARATIEGYCLECISKLQAMGHFDYILKPHIPKPHKFST